MRTFVILVLALCMSQVGFSRAEEIVPTREQLQTQINIMRDHIKYLESELNNQNRPSDPELEKAYTLTRLKQYEYLRTVMDINVSALHGQRVASNVILWLVVCVTLAGISFAGFQLWKSVAVAGVQTSSELEISASKVRVTSSIVGVVVLIISLIFLSVYATEIYQLRVVSGLQQQSQNK